MTREQIAGIIRKHAYLSHDHVWEDIIDDILALAPQDTKHRLLKVYPPLGEDKELIQRVNGASERFMQSKDLTDEEWLKLPKEEILQLYKNCYKLLMQFAQQEQSEQVTDKSYEPYFGWCDVDGCKNEGCCGGTGWMKSGYWTLCTNHSRMSREGKKQPKMKQSAIQRESRRDKKTGWLIKKQ
jgi:hypothetical protein